MIVDIQASNVHKMNTVAPQGSTLAPIRFLIYLNDLLVAISNLNHSFADNSTLPSSNAFNQPVSVTELNIDRRVEAAVFSCDFDIIIRG